ncbi:hypothetical protein CMQ_7221 [Grosmannia clavigera kw1407]|uniref:Uncharacterized protein n=1 Tax=Grosmannia clavigera (strain kw1407 / UAMH 11150) TaxID=655863 RepID=F0XQK8_GROCL|nr:uncharacterized protein CMQ_7221 [Grosmannia clavigera kw1407]EFX00219.1 hypothetical protein CMQ_7221 [Grosmannia clavigera kw1407]
MGDTRREPMRAHILASINPFVETSARRPRREDEAGRHSQGPSEGRNEDAGQRERRSRLETDGRADGSREGSRVGDEADRDAEQQPNDTDSRSSRHEHRHKHRHKHRHEHRHHRTKRRSSRSPSRRRKRRHGEDGRPSTAAAEEEDPYADPPLDPDAAFRQSLFDAMADDEGAAYWEAVYGQPVHEYAREARQKTAGPDTDGLAAMTDDEYVDYVRRRMWERSHEGRREAREAQKRQKAADETRERERERERQRQRQRQDADADADRRRWADVEKSLRRGDARRQRRAIQDRQRRYVEAWTAWEAAPSATTIPWPVVLDGGTNRPTGEELAKEAGAFFSCSQDDDDAALRQLRDERVRWHPDKIQQRLGGSVDAAVMRDVTAVFQVVDKLWAEARTRR